MVITKLHLILRSCAILACCFLCCITARLFWHIMNHEQFVLSSTAIGQMFAWGMPMHSTCCALIVCLLLIHRILDHFCNVFIAHVRITTMTMKILFIARPWWQQRLVSNCKTFVLTLAQLALFSFCSVKSNLHYFFITTSIVFPAD